MTAQQQVKDNYAVFLQGLRKIEDLIDQNALDDALQAANEVAYHAWMHHCGIFVSTALESLLAKISTMLPPSPPMVPGHGRRRLLTVMTSVHAVGGHSRIAWRWIKMDKASEHTLVLTQQAGNPIPEQLLQLQDQGRLTIVQLDAPSWCSRVGLLREQLTRADHVVLLTHPHDVVPCAAMPGMPNPPPAILLDHASHVFWLGVTISRVVLNTATVVLENRRGIPKQHIGWALLPMDFSHLDAPAPFDARMRFGIPSDATLLLSCGSSFKFWPIEDVSLSNLIHPVLERHSHAHLLVIGVTATPFWDALMARFPGRIHLQGYMQESELVACYHACDIYLDSLPLSSPTTLLEAAAAGKPIVRYAAAEWRTTGFSLEFEGIPTSFYLWSTPSSYEKDIDRLISDPSFRAWRGQFGQRAVRLYYADDTFLHTVESAYERASNLSTIKVRPDAENWTFERLDQLLGRLSVNMALQRESERERELQRHYQDWLTAGSAIPEPLLPKLKANSNALHLTVAVAPHDRGEMFARTRASLDAQLRPADHVVLTCDTTAWTTSLANAQNGWTLLLCAGDTLAPDALLLLERAILQQGSDSVCLAYFDHDDLGPQNSPYNPQFKPAFNHDLLLSYPYTGRALAVRTEWARPNFKEPSAKFDLVLAYQLALRALSDAGEKGFIHVPALLAHLTTDEPAIFATTSEAWQELAQIAAAYLETTSPGTQLIDGPAPGTFHRLYPLARTPLVSIVIPTRDQLPFLSRCIESLLEKTNYPNFEVLVVDNDSQTLEAQEFLAGLAQLAPERIRVLYAPGAFNFSRMNNLAVQEARGEFILMLNNDTAALQPDWLTHMVRNALRDDVGIVGARLLYPDGRLQHAGVILGLRGPAEHPFLGLEATDPGYLCRAQVQQDFSAVTAACLLVRKSLYQELGGLDEIAFGVSYNDVDFCLRVGQTGKRIVWTPLATLLHEGSASQKNSIEASTEEMKVARFTREQASMYQRWPKLIANDPAYNPNLSLAEHGYEIETNTLLRFDKLQGLTEKRVLAFAADDHGCGQYRILQPLQAMREAGLCTGGASPEMLGPNLVLRSGADTLVFQRPNDDISLDILESLIPLKGIKKIYEVDDNLSRVPLKSAHHQLMPKDLRGRITKAIGLCDRLVVSTEALAHELAGKCGDTRVILNRLPPAMWGQVPPRRPAATQRPPSSKPRVGWAGGAGHLGDLEMIAEVIRDLADQVDWIFFGMCPDSIRPYVHEFYEGIPTLDYPKALMAQDWDLAIAPLEVNPFNECKSNLKLLEYGWCGVPVVCSDITPYQGDLPATRVKNRFKDWRSAILEHIADLDASRRMGLALQEQVAKDWMLTGDNLQSWYAAWTD